MLDRLVPDTDKLPETVRITFLQRAVQQNHDLRQIHVLDSVWRSKTGSTGQFTFEVYYGLLWDAAYQYDINKATKHPQRKAFISHQDDSSHVFEHGSEEEDSANDRTQDEPFPYSVFQSSFNPSAPKKSTKTFIPYEIWGGLPEAAKQMIIEYNKKIKVTSPKPYLNGGKTKPNPTLGKPNSTHNKSILMRRLTIQNINLLKLLPKLWYMNAWLRVVQTHQTSKMSCQFSMQKGAIHHKILQANFQFTKDMCSNQSTHHLIDRGAIGGLAGGDMRVLQKPTGRSTLLEMMIMN